MPLCPNKVVRFLFPDCSRSGCCSTTVRQDDRYKVKLNLDQLHNRRKKLCVGHVERGQHRTASESKQQNRSSCTETNPSRMHLWRLRGRDEDRREGAREGMGHPSFLDLRGTISRRKSSFNWIIPNIILTGNITIILILISKDKWCLYLRLEWHENLNQKNTEKRGSLLWPKLKKQRFVSAPYLRGESSLFQSPLAEPRGPLVVSVQLHPSSPLR